MSAPSLLHAVSHYRRWAVHSRLHLIASPVWLSLRTIWCIAMYGRMRAQPTAPAAWNRTPSSSPRQMPGSDPLGSVMGMKADAKEMRRLLATLADSSHRNSDWWGGATLDGMAEGVRARGADAKAALKGDRDVFLRMFEHRPGPVGHAAVHLLGVLGLPDDAAAAETLKRAEARAVDRKVEAALRAGALELLARAKSDHQAHLLESLLDPQEPDPVQIAAVKALNSVRGPKVGALLLAKW